MKIHNRHDPSDKLALLQIHNMIPVFDEVISLLNIEAQDDKYKNLLYKEYEFLKINTGNIEKKAAKL